MEIVKTYKKYDNGKIYNPLFKQLLRSGTSIGANVEEAIGGQSENDFLAKISIAYKESRETLYWLKLLMESGYIDNSDYDILNLMGEEVCKIISKIIITMKARNS